MIEEYLDIVDENNNLTGEKKSRKEVHASGLRHRVVHVYYFMKKDNEYYFLVHLRSKIKDLSPNKWDTRFGGHVKTGKTIEESLVRELKEEIGVKINLNNFISGPVSKKNDYLNNEFAYVFYYEGQEDVSNLIFKDHEVQKVKWMLASEIIKETKANFNDWTKGSQVFESVYDFLVELK